MNEDEEVVGVAGVRPKTRGVDMASSAGANGRRFEKANGIEADDGSEPEDPLREELLSAASRVFASKGYYGTKIMDIVREAGLSSGAIYGRFNSKNELLIEAVVGATIRNATTGPEASTVADFITRSTADHRGPLTELEALQLESFVAARREPEVADALAQATGRWRAAVQPVLQAALEEGTVSPDIEVESLLYFLEALHLGLFLQRGAGMQPPEPEAWETFVRRLVLSMAPSQEHQSRQSPQAGKG